MLKSKISDFGAYLLADDVDSVSFPMSFPADASFFGIYIYIYSFFVYIFKSIYILKGVMTIST